MTSDILKDYNHDNKKLGRKFLVNVLLDKDLKYNSQKIQII